MALIVVMVSSVYTHPLTHQSVYVVLNMHNFLYANQASIIPLTIHIMYEDLIGSIEIRKYEQILKLASE